MSDLRSYRSTGYAERRRPSIADIRRLSTVGMVTVAGLVLLMLGVGLFELIHLIIVRMIDAPTTPRLLPAAVESLIRVTQLM